MPRAARSGTIGSTVPFTKEEETTVTAVAEPIADQDMPTILSYAMPGGTKKSKKGKSKRTVEIRIGTTRFPCRPTLDGLSLLEFAQALSGISDLDDDDDVDEESLSPEEQAERMKTFMSAANTLVDLLKLVIVDYDRFREFVRDNGIDIELIAEMAGDVLGAYTSRPTEQPSGS